jgi:hypothetical protein
LIYPAYVVAAVHELYVFFMQRSAPEIDRDNQIDEKTSRYMLPLRCTIALFLVIGIDAVGNPSLQTVDAADLLALEPNTPTQRTVAPFNL